VTFRDRLLGTLRVLQPILEEPGVLVVGSEVPNLLETNAASTLVVSQDVDLAVPIDRVTAIKPRLRRIEGLVQSGTRDATETYVFEDAELPLMVFGPLGLLRPGHVVEVEGLRVPLPRAGDLMIEKLLTDRTGEKGARDLLVVAGLIDKATEADMEELVSVARRLSPESRHAICASLTVLSLMQGRPWMPDPTRVRHQVTLLLARLEALGD